MSFFQGVVFYKKTEKGVFKLYNFIWNDIPNSKTGVVKDFFGLFQGMVGIFA